MSSFPSYIIIPVYRNEAATRACVESVLASDTDSTPIVVINDASPEPEVVDYCESLQSNPRITVIHNTENLGFVKTVNIGMRLYEDLDPVLLNSDTQVAGDWLSRLWQAAYAQTNIGTVTPFSNNAEICSYPTLCWNGELLAGATVAFMHDMCVEANNKKILDLPTAVGFCMYIRRECLSQVGEFDEDAFGKGYGEENDFCLRAEGAGWRNVLSADCFVYHQGGTSFQGEKAALANNAEKVIAARYPEYFDNVHQFIKNDPVASLRQAIDQAIFDHKNEPGGHEVAQSLKKIREAEETVPNINGVDSQVDAQENSINLTPAQVQSVEAFLSSKSPRLLFVTHGWGGGVSKYIDDLLNITRADVVVAKGLGDGGVEFNFYQSGQLRSSIRAGRFNSHNYQQWLGFFSLFQFDAVHLHHVHGWPVELIRLLGDLEAPLDITLHDYFLVSPCYHLDPSGARNTDSSWPDNDAAWQAELAPLVTKARRVIAPSASVAAAYVEAYGEQGLAVMAHPEKIIKPAQAYKVLLLGALSQEKGLDIVEQVASLAARSAPTLGVHLIGYSTEPTQAPIYMTGSYNEGQLPELIAAQKPDVIWMPAQVPETYSYTLSHAIASGVPIVASDLGSLADRLADVEQAQLVDKKASAENWLNALKAASGYRQVESQIFSDNTKAYRDWYMEPNQSAPKPKVGVQSLLESMEHFQAMPPEADRPIKSLFQYGWRTGHQGVLADIERRLAPLDDLETEVVGMTQYRHLNDELQKYKPLQEVVACLRSDHQHELNKLNDEHRFNIESLQTDKAHLSTALREAHEDSMAMEQGYEARLAAADETIHLYSENLAQAQKNIAALQDQARSAQSYIDELEQRLVNKNEDIAQKDAEIREFQGQLHAIINSTSWKITRPMRVAIRVLRRLPSMIMLLLRHLVRPASYARLLGMVKRGQWRAIAGRLGYEVREQQAQAEAQQALAREQDQKLKEFSDIVAVQATLEPLQLATSSKPLLSIVIPVYGQHDTTHQCLQSLVKNPPAVPFEVVIADDCSPEPAADALAMVSGVRFYRGDTNLGFVGNMNAGAEQALGEYLVLLNNDTVVCAHAFDRLLATFSEHDKVGLVGAKLLNADGSLQEAGGIIWRDGSGWNWGRGMNAKDPRFNYVRDVDYCSGAVLAIRRDLFAEMGGFDTHYMPAYYEDTDLAFRIRQKGLRVLYQPAAEVFHIEGVSHGRDENSGIKAHQVTNGKKFFERWQGVLASHNDNAVDPDNECHRGTKGNVLVIEACMITPDQDSGSIRMFNLLKVLKDEGYHVTFIADNLEYRPKVIADLNAIGIEVLYNEWAGSVRSVLRKLGPRLDAVLISRHYIASQYAALVRAVAPKARLIFDTVDLHFVREEREAELSGDSALADQASVTKRKELALIDEADVTLVVSEYEKNLLAEIRPEARVEIVSNIHSHRPARPDYAEREGILFVGGFRHPPNIDAMQWYGEEVLPHLRALLPGVVTTVIGSHMPDDIKAMAADDVRVLGFVEDIEPELQSARVSIAPLRYGAGVKGKVNEAMNYGIPVVATRCAVEGMHTVDGEDVLVAEDALGFARKIAEVYNDPELWQRISQGGIQNLESHFSPEAARPALQRSIEG